MRILQPLKNQSESWKSPGNLFLKKGANYVSKSLARSHVRFFTVVHRQHVSPASSFNDKVA